MKSASVYDDDFLEKVLCPTHSVQTNFFVHDFLENRKRNIICSKYFSLKCRCNEILGK